MAAHARALNSAGRLLARVGYSWHQGNRSTADVLEQLQAASTHLLEEEAPLLLHYRKALKLQKVLGKVGLGTGLDIDGKPQV